jgi:hypothetical protein
MSYSSIAEEITLDCLVDGNIITSYGKSLIEKQHVTVEINDSSELYRDAKVAPTFISVIGSDDLTASVWTWEPPKKKTLSLIVNNSTKNKYDIKTVMQDGGSELEQTVTINRLSRLLTVSKATRMKNGTIMVTYSGLCQKTTSKKF